MSKKLISIRLDTQNYEDLKEVIGYLQTKQPDTKPTQTEAIRFALHQLAKSIKRT